MSPEEQEQAQAVAAFENELEKEGPSPRLVYVLIATNLLVFIVMVLNGVNILTPESQDLFRWGANYPPATVHGQWWRLLTSTFIHIGLMHLAFNMYVLWAGGLRMERILGHLGFTITYFLSGLVGSVATLMFHPAAVGAGASGAIFGIYGALLGFLARDRNSIPRPVFVAMGKSTLIFLGYNLVFSLKPGIDLSAHFGGLVAGFLCGLVLSRPVGEGASSSPIRLHAITLAAGMVVVGSLAAAISKVNRESFIGGLESQDVAGVEEIMKKLLQEHFDSQKDVAGIKVRKVNVLHQEKNNYSGTVLIWWIDREVNLSLEFKTDGEKVSWSLGALP
jgi:rhomboid protease GluP